MQKNKLNLTNQDSRNWCLKMVHSEKQFLFIQIVLSESENLIQLLQALSNLDNSLNPHLNNYLKE